MRPRCCAAGRNFARLEMRGIPDSSAALLRTSISGEKIRCGGIFARGRRLSAKRPHPAIGIVSASFRQGRDRRLNFRVRLGRSERGARFVRSTAANLTCSTRYWHGAESVLGLTEADCVGGEGPRTAAASLPWASCRVCQAVHRAKDKRCDHRNRVLARARELELFHQSANE